MNTPPKKYRIRHYFKKNLPVSVFKAENSPAVYPPGKPEIHQREFWKIVYITKGCGTLLINGRRYPVSPGFVCLSHPDDLTTWELTESITLYNILFLRKFIADDLKRLNNSYGFFSIFDSAFRPDRSLNHELLHLLDANRNIYTLVRKMAREFESDSLNSDELLRLYLLELLIGLARLSFQSCAKRRKEGMVDFIRSHLESCYGEPLNIRRLAAEAGLSRGYLHAFYKRKTGETIGRTLLNIRIRKAVELLRETALSVERICYRCGFSDPANFYRTFKRETGKRPGDFRP